MMYRITSILCLLFSLSTFLNGHEDIRKKLDSALEYKRKDEMIPLAVLDACSESFKSYYENLSEKQKTDNTNFTEPDRTEYYLNCVRASLVMPTEHGGWPQRSTLRLIVKDQLIQQVRDAMAKNNTDIDAMRIYGFFRPAIDTKKTEVAIQAYELLLKHDPFLAKQALFSCYDHLTNTTWVETYYLQANKEAKAKEVRKFFSDALFPKGKKQLKLSECKSPPQAGVRIVNNSTNDNFDVKANDIIVSIDGWLALDFVRYSYLNHLASNQPEMKLIIWRESSYREVTVISPSRKLGVEMISYEPPYGKQQAED